MHLGRNIDYECINGCQSVSQSVIHQVLNTSNEMFNEGIILQ